MTDIQLNKFPSKIFKDTYIKLDTYEEIDKDKINESIESDVNDYINNEKERFTNNVIDSMTKNTKDIFLQSKVEEYFKTSYLVKIKNSENADKYEATSTAMIKDESDDIKALHTALNKIIRKVIKDRKNDFAEVIEDIKNKALLYSTDNKVEEFIDELEDTEDLEDIDESTNELVDAIEELEDKQDKLTKYISDAVSNIYTAASIALKDTYKEYLNRFIEDNKEIIDSKVSKHMTAFSSYSEEYKEKRKRNIINVFDTVIRTYYNYINFVDDGKYITMITDVYSLSQSFKLTSGKINPEYYNIKTDTITEIDKYGNSFTIIIDKLLNESRIQ